MLSLVFERSFGNCTPCKTLKWTIDVNRVSDLLSQQNIKLRRGLWHAWKRAHSTVFFVVFFNRNGGMKVKIVFSSTKCATCVTKKKHDFSYCKNSLSHRITRKQVSFYWNRSSFRSQTNLYCLKLNEASAKVENKNITDSHRARLVSNLETVNSISCLHFSRECRIGWICIKRVEFAANSVLDGLSIDCSFVKLNDQEPHQKVVKWRGCSILTKAVSWPTPTTVQETSYVEIQ